MSVSYANVVATGSTSSTTAPVAETKPEPVVDAATAPEEPSESTNEEDGSHLPSPKASPKQEKTKVTLAPAPVPQVNAWGASADSSRSNSNVSQVDSKHWPSPLDGSSSVNGVKSAGSKKIAIVKSSKEKWVPIKASVTLSTNVPKKNNANKRSGSNGKSTSNSNNKTNVNEKKRKSKSEKTTTTTAASATTAAPKQQKPKETQEKKDVEKVESKSEQQPESTAESSLQPESEPVLNSQPQLQAQVDPSQLPPQQHFYQPQQHFHAQQRPFRTFNPQRRYNGNKFNNNNSNNFQYRPNGRFHRFQGPKLPEPQFSLTKQVEYYFSKDNLAKDLYLRKHMNEDGWVPLGFIAGFYRMQVLSGHNLDVVKQVFHEMNGGAIELGKRGEEEVVRAKEDYKSFVLAVDQRDEAGKADGEVTLIEKVEKEEEEQQEQEEEQKQEEEQEQEQEQEQEAQAEEETQ